MKIQMLNIKAFHCCRLKSICQCFKTYWKRIILGIVLVSCIGVGVGAYLYVNSESYYRNELSFNELYEKAKGGNAKAQYVLSNKYAYGDDKDEYKEMYWLESAANNGYAKASERLGDHYNYSKEKEKEKALHWYKKAYSQGANVSFRLAKLYADKGDYEQAIKFYKKTDHGDSYPESYSELAELYDKKLKDGKEAEKWYLKEIDEVDYSFKKSGLILALIQRYDDDYYDIKGRSSSVKNNLIKMRQLYHQLGRLLDKNMKVDAERHLAMTYLTGKKQFSDGDVNVIVEQNIDKGMKILERLSLNDGESTYILGGIYETGNYRYNKLGIKVDLEKAKFYYKRACEQYYSCFGYERLSSGETN